MTIKNRPELLLPAGNPEKLAAALRFGADAVYFAGKAFGMRSAADNFTMEEICEGASLAHKQGAKAYLTVNVMPHGYEYGELRSFLYALSDTGIDAVIAADLGVIAAVKEILPEIDIHVSTQASIVSAPAAEQYLRLGCKRVVLARELTMEEIKALRRDTSKELELEAFIHGSMCISYSGRCLLSGQIVGRDANRGMCAQPCRWNYSIRGYEISEEKRPDAAFPVEEINGETFIMASRDTCTIEHIPELIEAGIDSFKIEGRMKSAYYTAVVTNTYKMAIDSYFSGSYEYNPLWYRELESVSHRDYATGYYYSDSHTDANLSKTSGYIKDKAYLAVAVGYNKETGLAEFTQRNKMVVGDSIELLTPGKTGVSLTVTKLYDENMNEITGTSHPYMKFFMEVPFEIKAGDIIRAS